MRNAHIAQSVEHFLGKEEVTGSSPVVGSSLTVEPRFCQPRFEMVFGGLKFESASC